MSAEIWKSGSQNGGIPVRLVLTVFDETLSGITGSSLEREGFQVYETSDLDEAQRCLREDEPDVFLLDVTMPGGESGLDWTAARSTEIMATETLVLLLSSGPPTDADRERERALTNVFFIPKPNLESASQEALVRQLQRALALLGKACNEEPEPVPLRGETDRKLEESNGGFAYRFGPVPLRGSLEDVSFLELICDCYATCQNGRLHLSRDGVEKTIFLLGGYPIYVQSNQPDESLFERIRRDQMLDQSSLEFMQSEMKLSDLRATRILVEKNLIRTAHLHSLLTESFTKRLSGLFAWKSGSFYLDDSGAFGDRNYSFSISPARIIVNGVFSEMDDEALSKHLVVEPGMIPYGRDSGLWVNGELVLTKLEVIIARQLMAKRSLAGIAEATGEPIEYVAKLLTSFFMLGMVGFKPPPPVEKPVVAKPSLPPPPMRLTPQPPAIPQFGQIVAELARVAGADFYEVLDVARDAPMKEIHRVFRQKIKPYRSDALSNLPDDDRQAGEEVARRLTEAYMVLSNVEHRELYTADLEGPVYTPDEAAHWARERRLESRHSPITGSPVSSWNLTPPPESSPPGRAILTPTPPPMSPRPSPAPRGATPAPSRVETVPPPRARQHDRLQEAKDALDVDDTAKAITLLKAALARNRDDPTLLAWYEWALFRQDPHKNAYRSLSQLETARQSAPRLPDIHLLMARISEFQGDYAAAKKHYRVVVNTPDLPVGYLKEARAFEQRLKEAKARQKEAPKKDVVEILNEDVGDLFRHYVLRDKKIVR